MPELSIVFGYRNRESLRVKRCLDSLEHQSYKDFEVVFVDYGSDKSYKQEVEELVKNYDFARYIYNDTRGMPWNRSHALNTGIRKAEGRLILLGDIDLIYSPKVLEALINTKKEGNQVYARVTFLPETFDEWESLYHKSFDFRMSSRSGKGGVHLIEKSVLEQLKGYDEFYCYWGVEDRDLNERLVQAGVKDAWIEDRKDVKIYHQWHPVTSDLNESGFPDKWWEEMNIHYGLNQGVMIRNENWGHCYTTSDRPALDPSLITVTKQLKIENRILGAGSKTRAIKEILFGWKNLKPGESIKVGWPSKDRNQLPAYPGGMLNVLNKIMRRLLNLEVLPSSYHSKLEKYASYYADQTNSFRPNEDMTYVVWSLIKLHEIPCDYAFFNDRNKTEVILHKKKITE